VNVAPHPEAAAILARDVVGKPILKPAVPTVPTLIRPLPEKPLQAASLDDLARHIHRLRASRGLRIGPLAFASHGGSDTFPGFSLFAIDPDTGGEDWLGFAAVQAPRADALQDALRRTEQREAA
jgi:hypothetical protein